jgi:hypothetical protein
MTHVVNDNKEQVVRIHGGGGLTAEHFHERHRI